LQVNGFNSTSPASVREQPSASPHLQAVKVFTEMLTMPHQQYGYCHVGWEREIQCICTYDMEVSRQGKTDGRERCSNYHWIDLYGIYTVCFLSDPKGQIEVSRPDFYHDVFRSHSFQNGLVGLLVIPAELALPFLQAMDLQKVGKILA